MLYTRGRGFRVREYTRLCSNADCAAEHHTSYCVVPGRAAPLSGEETKDKTMLSYPWSDVQIMRSTSETFFEASAVDHVVFLYDEGHVPMGTATSLVPSFCRRLEDKAPPYCSSEIMKFDKDTPDPPPPPSPFCRRGGGRGGGLEVLFAGGGLCVCVCVCVCVCDQRE